MKESLYLGIDLGTSSLKGVCADHHGTVRARASSEYALISERSGYSEQDPQDWFHALQQVITDLIRQEPHLKRHIKGISISGQMHSLVALDKHGLPLRHALLWNDVRNTEESEFLVRGHYEMLLSITRNRSFEGFTLPKLLWLQTHERHLYDQIARIMLPKDYLVFRLTGQHVMDYSDASGTLMFDPAKKIWSDEILRTFAIPYDTLPRLVASQQKVGIMSASLQHLFRFEVAVSVYGGGADNACGAFGAGVIDETQGLISIGTSGVVLKCADGQRDADARLHHFLHVTQKPYEMGVTLSAGSSLTWLKNMLGCEKETFADFLKEVEADTDTAPLIFSPYLQGERCPYADGMIRASLIGLDAHHTRQDIIRAVMEGVVFSLKDCLEIMDHRALQRVVSIGGGAQNEMWLQMQADILEMDLVTIAADEGPALGAAMLVALGCGDFGSFAEVVDRFVRYRAVYTPDRARHARYSRLYACYRKVYHQTRRILEPDDSEFCG